MVGSKNQLRDLPSVRFENLENDGIRVLFIGNSITLHGKAPELGWHGDWGMAASAKENNYPCCVLSDLSEKNEMKALGLFEHSGVAGHPGDFGMQAIAKRICELI